MKRVAAILVFSLVCIGCATRRSAWVQYLNTYSAPSNYWEWADSLKEITEYAKTLSVPLPNSTPYDKSDFEKRQYLAGFAEGWKSGVRGVHKEITIVHIDKPSPWVDGYWTGVKAYTDPLINFLKKNKLGSNKSIQATPEGAPD